MGALDLGALPSGVKVRHRNMASRLRAKSRRDPGPFSEMATLSFEGDAIRPEDSKGKRATITFSARAGLIEENRSKPPQSIGMPTANEDGLTAYIFSPD